jgi:hypothetical protein
MSTKPKRHHYLPQSYLRGFARNELLWVYDRKENEVRPQMVIDTAVKSYFNAIKRCDGELDFTVESDLAEIDALIPKLVSDLRDKVLLDQQRRFDLSLVVALSIVRGPDFHEMINRVEGDILKKLTRLTVSSEEDAAREIADWRKTDPDAPEILPSEMYEFIQNDGFNFKIHRNRSIELMVNLAPKFAEILNNFNIGVIHAPKGAAFITTDRPLGILPPLTRDSLSDYGCGLLFEGAQKYFPLASDLALVFCSSGEGFSHFSVRKDFVKLINLITGTQTDRFLIGTEKALVERWAKRLNLAGKEKIQRMQSIL